jgi:hypothetical protein
MLKLHANQLYDAIRLDGMRPEDFDVDKMQEGGEEYFKLSYRGTPFSFIVRVSPDSYELFECMCTKFAPDFPMSAWMPPAGFAPLVQIELAMHTWIHKHLKLYLEEQTTPDLWAEAQGQAEFIRPDLDSPDAQRLFSDEEKNQIRLSIKQAKMLLKETLAPTAEQLKRIEQRLDYLAEAVDRLNKFDWKGVLLNTIIGVTTALSLDTHRGEQVLKIFKDAFSGVVHLLR